MAKSDPESLRAWEGRGPCPRGKVGFEKERSFLPLPERNWPHPRCCEPRDRGHLGGPAVASSVSASPDTPKPLISWPRAEKKEERRGDCAASSSPSAEERAAFESLSGSERMPDGATRMETKDLSISAKRARIEGRDAPSTVLLTNYHP